VAATYSLLFATRLSQVGLVALFSGMALTAAVAATFAGRSTRPLAVERMVVIAPLAASLLLLGASASGEPTVWFAAVLTIGAALVDAVLLVVLLALPRRAIKG
jgi:hypothetical protein